MSLAFMDNAIFSPAMKQSHDTSSTAMFDQWLLWRSVVGAADVASPPGLWNSFMEISEISKLEENWDGYGASRISESAIYHATGFLTAASMSLPAPDVVPNSNGTISLGWESVHSAAHLEIGTATFMLSIDTGREPVFISGPTSEIGRPLGEVISESLYPQPTPTASHVQFAANFRRAA